MQQTSGTYALLIRLGLRFPKILRYHLPSHLWKKPRKGQTNCWKNILNANPCLLGSCHFITEPCFSFVKTFIWWEPKAAVSCGGFAIKVASRSPWRLGEWLDWDGASHQLLGAFQPGFISSRLARWSGTSMLSQHMYLSLIRDPTKTHAIKNFKKLTASKDYHKQKQNIF